MNRQGRRSGIAVLLAGMVMLGAGSSAHPAAANTPGAGHVHRELVGTEWEVATVVEPSGGWRPDAGIRTHLKFDGEGRFGARMCNHYSGDVRVTDGELHVGQVMGTLMACPGEEAAVEDAFRHVVRETVAWSISHDELVLSKPDGHALRLRPRG